jgi:hypothetical protein
MAQTDELIVPVYLNQRIVFDMIAMLEGGISTVTRISSMESSAKGDDRRYGAAFGLSQALSSLLKIDISGERSQKKDDSMAIKKDLERVHTPSSLMQSLRIRLKEEKRVTLVEKTYQPEAGHIVEFKAFLRRNPLIQTMDAFVGLMDLAIIFTENRKQMGTKKGEADENIKIRKQMEKFLQILRSGESVDIVSDTLSSGHRAVITLEQEYLSDPTMSDLVDGQFNVLAKVIRVVPDASSSIGLFRKSALGAMPKAMREQAFTQFSKLSKEQGFGIPELEWEISGPAIHVLPISIFA